MKIPEIKLVTKPETPEAKEAVGYKWNKEIGIRHKLGGSPDFLQEADFPKCEDCGVEMTFYGQLDSIGDDYDLADCGLIYVFVCFDCFTTKSLLHAH